MDTFEELIIAKQERDEEHAIKIKEFYFKCKFARMKEERLQHKEVYYTGKNKVKVEKLDVGDHNPDLFKLNSWSRKPKDSKNSDNN